MEIWMRYDDCAAVEASLKSLRRYNRAMYVSLDEGHVDRGLLETFFRSQEDSDEELFFRGLLGAAAIRSCNDNPDIPQECKRAVGSRMCREFLEVVQAAKEDYLYYSGQLGAPGQAAEREHQQRLRDFSIVRKALLLDKLKEKLKAIPKDKLGALATEVFKDKVLKELIDSAPPIKVVRVVLELAWAFLPDEVKEFIRNHAKEAFRTAGNEIGYYVKRMQDTPLGRIIKPLYKDKIQPLYIRGVLRFNSIRRRLESSDVRIRSHMARYLAMLHENRCSDGPVESLPDSSQGLTAKDKAGNQKQPARSLHRESASLKS